MKRNYPYFISAGLILFAILWRIIKGDLSLISLSDTLFMLGLPFLIIGILLWVFSSGFFDTFQRSMHEALRRKQKKKANYMPLSQVGHGVYPFWLKIAGIVIGLSVILLTVSMI